MTKDTTKKKKKRVDPLDNVSVGDYYAAIKAVVLGQVVLGKNKVLLPEGRHFSKGQIVLFVRWASFDEPSVEFELWNSIMDVFLTKFLEEYDYGKFPFDTKNRENTETYFSGLQNAVLIHAKYLSHGYLISNSRMIEIERLLIDAIEKYLVSGKKFKGVDRFIDSFDSIAISYDIQDGLGFQGKEKLPYPFFSERFYIDFFKLAIKFNLSENESVQEVASIVEATIRRLSGDRITFAGGGVKIKWKNADELLSIIEEFKKSFASVKNATEKELALAKAMVDKIPAIEAKLKERIIGQEEGITAIVSSLKRLFLHANKRPVTYLFAGPSGVGKTETAIEFARVVGTKECKIALGNFHDRHTSATLTGSAFGYVGFDQETPIEKYLGELASSSVQYKLPVIILDEIEKADSSIQNVFLELFDTGFLRLLNGKTYDLRHSVIFMTSNLGVRTEKKVGFDTGDKDEKEQEMKNGVEKAVKSTLLPEVINRLDAMVVFNSLTDSDFEKIAIKAISDVADEFLRNEFVSRSYDTGKVDLIRNADIPSLAKTISEKVGSMNVRLIEKEAERHFLSLL